MQSHCLGQLLLGAAADGLGGALMATGIGALGPGEALILAGSALAVTGTATVASAVAAPNIAYAVQNGDGGGGGDGGGSDGASSEDSDRDRDAQSLRQEHKGEDGEPQLTLDNAYRALDGAPEGTRARVMPKENELTSKPNAPKKEKVHNPDLEYLDQQGDIVGYGEVKTIGEANGTTANGSTRLFSICAGARTGRGARRSMRSSSRSPTWPRLRKSSSGSAATRTLAGAA